MSREIPLNAFHMNTVGHQSPGLWAHPRCRSRDYNRLDGWVELARTLERGLFDGLFLADVLGIYDVYGHSPDAALRHAVQVPVNDPLALVPAMAMATRHLGFGVTCTLSYEPPYTFARRMSTLDHLTDGRIGWNIVTGYLNSAALGMGQQGQTGHDRRYDMAEDYMAAVYKLWEASWEDDAVRRDADARVFTDPAKVHRVRHEGEFYRLDAIHLAEPSPQRTPVLYQAGSSGRGRDFAARHAECVFINGPSPQTIRPSVDDIRRRAVLHGRRPEDILIFALATVIVGRDDAEAEAKLADYRAYVNHEASLTLLAGWTGIDFSAYELDAVLEHVQTEAMHSAVESFTTADPGRTWTIRDLAEHAAIGGRGPVIAGSPATVADRMEAWLGETGCDGFNLAYAVLPETFVDFVDLVVPELQRRGRYKRAYAPGTLRQKLYGGDARLAPPHPAAAVRRR
jgi:long-chain alkane monooxygenase